MTYRAPSKYSPLRPRPRQQPIEWACDEQREAFEYGPAPLCCSGGYRAAKTYAFALKALYLSDLYPGNRGVIARSVWADLQKTTMVTFFKLCHQSMYNDGGQRSDSTKYLRLNNGSEILWMHLEDVDTVSIIRGLEINWFFIDQAEQVTEEIYDHLSSRLGSWDQARVPAQAVIDAGGTANWGFVSPQTGDPMPPTYPMLACNPGSEDHWIYQRFHPESEEHARKHLVDEGRSEELLSYKDLGYRMIFMHPERNRFLPEHAKQSIRMGKNREFIRRFWHGKWGNPEGTIHDISDLSILTFNPEDKGRYVYVPDYFSGGVREFLIRLVDNCRLYRSFDHGDTAPTCCLWYAVNKDNFIFCYREYYQADMLVRDHREMITRWSGSEEYAASVADPSIFSSAMQKHDQRWSYADEYKDKLHGHDPDTAIVWKPGDNNDESNRDTINDWLRVDRSRLHPVTKKPGSPRLFFLARSSEYDKGCDRAISEAKSQRRKKGRLASGKVYYMEKRAEGVADHAYDPLRYLAGERPVREAVEHPLSEPVGSFDYHRMRIRTMRKAARLSVPNA